MTCHALFCHADAETLLREVLRLLLGLLDSSVEVSWRVDRMSYRVTQEIENLSNRCFACYIWLCLLADLFLSFY